MNTVQNCCTCRAVCFLVFKCQILWIFCYMQNNITQILATSLIMLMNTCLLIMCILLQLLYSCSAARLLFCQFLACFFSRICHTAIVTYWAKFYLKFITACSEILSELCRRIKQIKLNEFLSIWKRCTHDSSYAVFSPVATSCGLFWFCLLGIMVCGL